MILENILSWGSKFDANFVIHFYGIYVNSAFKVGHTKTNSLLKDKRSSVDGYIINTIIQANFLFLGKSCYLKMKNDIILIKLHTQNIIHSLSLVKLSFYWYSYRTLYFEANKIMLSIFTWLIYHIKSVWYIFLTYNWVNIVNVKRYQIAEK